MLKKKVLITGVCGLLGQNLVKVMGRDFDLLGVDILPGPSFLKELLDYRVADITSPKAVKDALSALKPDVIINTAAMTNVDLCEKEQDKADLINHRAVRILLESMEKGTRFVQISTDYVFDGTSGPYSDEDSAHPVSYYGLTKLRAEKAVHDFAGDHLIVRTMVLFGTGFNLKPDFITWVKTSLEAGKEITVVTDQIGNITLASNLAANILALLKGNIRGVVSLSGTDILSRFDIARETARFYGLNGALIKPILTSALKQAAPRPLSSGFVHNRAWAVEGIALLTFQEQMKVYDDEQKSLNRTAHV